MFSHPGWQDATISAVLHTEQGSGNGNVERVTTLPGSLSKKTEPAFKKESTPSNLGGFYTAKQNYQISLNEYAKTKRSVAMTNPISGELFQDLNEKVKAMVEKTHNVTASGKKMFFICKSVWKT